jgi:hypothetical protein
VLVVDPYNKEMTGELIDDIINQCWDRIIDGDTTVVGRILVVITDLERALSVKSLLLRDELSLLESMIAKSPDLKLQKSEFKHFLLRLVKYTDFDKFLQDRFKISYGDLLMIANSTRTRHKIFTNEPQQRLEPTKKFNYRLASDLVAKENDILHRDGEIIALTDENYQLHADIKRVNLQVIDLKRQLESSNTYAALLETMIREKSTNDLPVKSIDNLKKIKQQDLMIELLEKQKNQLQQELDEFIKKDLQNELKFKQLANQINQSTKLQNSIKNKLQLDEPTTPSKKAQSFIKNLPFVKQYYLYYTYKQHASNPGMVMLNITTLVLTTILVLNMVQVMIYLAQTIFGSHSTMADYIYDLYRVGWNFDFVIWKKFDFIEGLMWEIEDWLQWD